MNIVSDVSDSGGNTTTPESGTKSSKQKPKIRNRHRRYCFTLNNYESDDVSKIMSFVNERHGKYVIGKEIGEKCKTPHLQGYIEFNNQIDWNVLQQLNPRIQWIPSRGSKEKNLAYCTKEGEYDTNFKVPLKVRLLKKYQSITWKDWQQEIINTIEQEPDSRSINYYWEETGNIGKSFLTKYLYLKYDCIIATGRTQDIFNQVNTWMTKNEGESPKLVVVDIPRNEFSHLNYNAIEKLKDGLLYSGKYEGGICALDDLHVVIFSNSPPNLDNTMSLDRWKIKYLGTKNIDNLMSSPTNL